MRGVEEGDRFSPFKLSKKLLRSPIANERRGAWTSVMTPKAGNYRLASADTIRRLSGGATKEVDVS
jgi:hypothetical protein